LESTKVETQTKSRLPVCLDSYYFFSAIAVLTGAFSGSDFLSFSVFVVDGAACGAGGASYLVSLDVGVGVGVGVGEEELFVDSAATAATMNSSTMASKSLVTSP
jgi:hypothetical protein